MIWTSAWNSIHSLLLRHSSLRGKLTRTSFYSHFSHTIPRRKRAWCEHEHHFSSASKALSECSPERKRGGIETSWRVVCTDRYRISVSSNQFICEKIKREAAGEACWTTLAGAQSTGRGRPAGLHGGWAEFGLICGTRPNELINSLSFTALDSDNPTQNVQGEVLAFLFITFYKCEVLV